MAIKINAPSIIDAAGNAPKRIEEYIGRVNSDTDAVSLARMVSPPGWREPGQRPTFDERVEAMRPALDENHLETLLKRFTR